MTSEPDAVMRPHTSIVVPACAVAKVLRVAFTDWADAAATMDALELAERLESLGTTLDTGADWDSAIVQLTALASRVPDAFAVLSEVLRVQEVRSAIGPL